MSFAALETYLEPFHKIFAEEGVSEVSINKPGEVWVERKGDMHFYEMPILTLEHLKGLGRLVAQSTDQLVTAEKPLLSATLPNGYRIQFVFPPACEARTVALSIRKPAGLEFTFDKYEKLGMFKKVAVKEEADPYMVELKKLLEKNKIKEFLISCVLNKKNIVVSGGTSSGKTTFMNAALLQIPSEERIITVEDAREINLPNQKNCAHLLASRGGQGVAKVTTQDLIEACLRLRPDRIIVGEIRGSEAFSFLRAINTGHPGSICSLHADTPMMAFEQIKLMVMQAGLGMEPEDIKKYIMSVVDVVVQLKRGDHGVRFVSEIYYKALHKDQYEQNIQKSKVKG